MTSLPIIGRRGVIAGTAVALAAPVALSRRAAAQTAAAPAAAGGQSAVIDVNRARAAPIPIAIPNLAGGPLGAQITGVITNDLRNSGLFRVIDQQAYISASDAGSVPNFQNWKAIGAQALVTGGVQDAGGSVRVEFRLWDVLPGQQLQGTAYTTTPANWRRIAHIIADVIYQRLLGEKGYFDTRIVYVSDTGPRGRRVRRLAVMDQDGANNRYLTDGRWMALTPRFHPTRDEICFMSFRNEQPRVYLFDLDSGQQRLLGNFRGMTLAPRFAPDGNSVVMAVTTDSGSDIVTLGLNGGGMRRLTNSGSIDVSPCYSPDGTQIVFNSDRGGDQQLYVMGADGSNVRRISFGKGRYGEPVWSPRGDLIAFTRIGDTFGIGVMNPDGSGERILAQGFLVEGPTFAPNGRVLMFYQQNAANAQGQGANSRLRTIDISGFNERPEPTPTEASDPAWSPLLS